MACCNGCLVKTNAFIAALLSVGVLAFSSFVLISSLTYSAQNNSTSQEDGSTTTPQSNTEVPLNQSGSDPDASTLATIIARIESDVQSLPPPPTGNNTLVSLEDSDPSTTTQSSGTTEPWRDVFQHHAFWKGKSETYIMLIQGSSGTGIFAAVLQLCFSWLLICGSRKDLKDRTKLWNLSNFIVLILLVVIILVPLTYNTATDMFNGTTAVGREIWRRIKSVEFSSSTLHIIWRSVSNFLVEDLTLYYYILGGDAFILVTFLILPLLSCLCYPCRRCCCKKKGYDRTDSDLMLFETNGDPF